MQTCFAVCPLRCITAGRGAGYEKTTYALVTKTESNRYTLHLNSIRNAQWILSSGESVQTCFAVCLRSASLRDVGEIKNYIPTAVVSQLAHVVQYSNMRIKPCGRGWNRTTAHTYPFCYASS